MSATSLRDERRRARTAPAAVDFLRGGGWRVVSPESGDRGGMTAHRGVLTADEWRFLDRDTAVAAVERHLGFALDELRSVYRQGRKSSAQAELCARVDARLLGLRRAGGNLSLLAAVLGLSRRTMENALRRARAAEAAAVRLSYMNLRLLNAATSARLNSNHSPFFRRSANRPCQ